MDVNTRYRVPKKSFKKSEKSLNFLLTSGISCDIITKLSRATEHKFNTQKALEKSFKKVLDK